MSDIQMSLVEHLTELRKRLLLSISALIVFSIGSYLFAERIIDILTHPVGKELV